MYIVVWRYHLVCFSCLHIACWGKKKLAFLEALPYSIFHFHEAHNGQFMLKLKGYRGAHWNLWLLFWLYCGVSFYLSLLELWSHSVPFLHIAMVFETVLIEILHIFTVPPSWPLCNSVTRLLAYQVLHDKPLLIRPILLNSYAGIWPSNHVMWHFH